MRRNGGPGVEFMEEVFHRTVGEHCIRCGEQNTLWGSGDSSARLCTACGTLTQLAAQPAPASDFWLTILGQIRKVSAR
jgi:hypothetical protein